MSVDATSLGGPGVDHDGAATARHGWILVAICCLLFAFSFVDRLILGLLTVDIGRDLKTTDTQLGLLIGTSFAVVYSFTGLPVAHYLDRANRKWIMTVGILLWGGMTVLSGFTYNFLTLAICRAGVALGEAVLTPGTISLIADFFPRQRRILPTAIYASMASLATIGGLIVGAAFYQFAQHISPDIGMTGWRITLILAGLPSVLLGLIFALVVREPPRGRYDDAALIREDQATTGVFIAHVKRNGAFYAPLYIGTALALIFLFAIMTWTPTLLIRAHGVAPASAGYEFGLVGVGVGVIASVFWPRLAVILGRRGYHDPLLAGLVIGAIINLPVAIVAPSIKSMPILLSGMALIIFAGNAISALMPLTIQTYGPPRLRARLMALVSVAQSLVGYGAGPLIVALIAKNWPGNAMALGYGLSVTAAFTAPGLLVSYWLARRALGGEPLK